MKSGIRLFHAALTLFWMLLSPMSFAADMYGAEPGSLTVRAVETLALFDQQRNKDILVRVTYPAEKGKYPLIVWSHGANGSKDIYQRLIKHWVSHGYVVIQPNHSDAQKAGNKGEKRETFGDWKSRPADITFVLDSLDEIEAMIDDLAGKIDRSAIGMGGHSFGAHTAQLVAGAEALSINGGGYSNYADKRPRAFILLSPQGTGQRDSQFDRGSWKNMVRPVLTATGSKDPGRTGKDWKWRLEPFLYSPPDDKYVLYVEGLYHGFGGLVESGLPTEGPENSAHAKYMQIATTDFWNAYLKDDKSARKMLSGDSLEKDSGGRAIIIRRGADEERIAELGQGSSQVGQGRDRAQRSGGPLPGDEIVERFDTDGNGTLSQSEMPPRLTPAFDNLDANRDGEVSATELEKLQQRRR